jgi:hypothetical protein
VWLVVTTPGSCSLLAGPLGVGGAGGGLAAPVLCLEDPDPKAGLADGSAASDALLSVSSRAADFRQTLGLAVRPLAAYTLRVSGGAAAGSAPPACPLALALAPLRGTTSFACAELTPGGAQLYEAVLVTPEGREVSGGE